MRTEVDPLSKIINSITNKEVLLPDFQRRFVWDDERSQGKLIASVLAKMPVGSILLLTSKPEEYAYKMIGCKERKTCEELGLKGDIRCLLDGQQRITVLTNAFSNVIFELAGSSSGLINRSLQRRFFLRIPKYNKKENDVEDLFNARRLVLPWEDAEKDEPSFLADDIFDAIKITSFNAGGNDCYNPFLKPQPPKSDLVNFCCSGDEYLIPLFLLTGGNDTWISQIIERISENIQIDIMSEFDDFPVEDKTKFVETVLTQDIRDTASEPDRLNERMVFEKELERQGRNWATNLRTYLNSCLNQIQLNQIIVDNRHRSRAINIYENLNKGGVPLGTFELVMAKYASVDNENYYDKIVSNIKKERIYPPIVYSNALKKKEAIHNYIDSDKYVAGKILKCLNSDSDEMERTYIDAYLDVISLYSHCSDFDPEKLTIAMLKREKILAVPASDLKNKCEEVCDALDSTLFFLQMRCGIRSIKEVNYSLMLVVIAYLLLNPKYRDKELTYDYLEAWYWITMFSGYFNSDQTDKTIASIKHLIEVLETGDISWLRGLESSVFKAEYFSEKEFLLLNKDDGTGILPKEFLRDTICQFFLAQTYKSLFESNDSKDSETDLTPFTTKTLHKHHVIPLGSLDYPNEVIRKSEENLRKKKAFFLNSPVNFVYITDEENILISDDKLSDYVVRIKNYSSKSLLGLVGDFNTESEDKCKKILANRFDDIVGKVIGHIDSLMP